MLLKSLSFRRLHIAVLYIGGYHTEIALMARLARDRGYVVQLVTGATLASEEFGLIAGPAAEGALFLDVADPRRRAEAAPVVERFRASGFEPEGYTLYAYGAVQVWAQAAEKAGSLELQATIASLRQHQFDTVLGPDRASTRRGTSRFKIRSGMSGGAISTCRWNKRSPIAKSAVRPAPGVALRVLDG